MPATEPEGLTRIAVVGDIHGSWRDADVAYFDRSPYDLILFVGDLGGGTLGSDLKVARSIARLGRPALVLPGNNDAVHMAQVAAEFTHQRGLIRLFAMGHQRRSRALANALGRVELVGYSAHLVPDADLTILAGRPHSMGGPDLSFAPFLESRFGIRTLDESTDRLKALIDASPTRRLLILSHNGPAGLGDRPDDIWGCDFKAGGGDWGDPDLTQALAYAREQGREVVAVVAGHMHLKVRRGGTRPWRVERSGVTHINTARVPRIFSAAAGGGRVHHHVSLWIGPNSFEAREVLVPEKDLSDSARI